jgi:hypothetical protein
MGCGSSSSTSPGSGGTPRRLAASRASSSASGASSSAPPSWSAAQRARAIASSRSITPRSSLLWPPRSGSGPSAKRAGQEEAGEREHHGRPATRWRRSPRRCRRTRPPPRRRALLRGCRHTLVLARAPGRSRPSATRSRGRRSRSPRRAPVGSRAAAHSCARTPPERAMLHGTMLSDSIGIRLKRSTSTPPE